MYRYATSDEKLIAAFRAWQEEAKAWYEKVDTMGKLMAREPVVTTLTGEARVTAFKLKMGESGSPSAWKGTCFVADKFGVRPRASHPSGKFVIKKMEEIGVLRHPASDLKGIPKMSGFLGRPAMQILDEKLVVSYHEKVKHDKRWAPVKESDYWKQVETLEAKK